VIDALGRLLGIEPAAYNDWHLVWLAPWGRIGMAVAGLVAALTLYWSWRGYRREPKPVWRVLLMALRTVAVAAALILFFEPAVELRHVTRQPNHVAVLVDDSRSMAIADSGEAKGPTRAERARRIIVNSAATFATWRQSHLVDFYTFSDTLVPTTEAALAAGTAPRADATQLREALAALRARHDGHDLGGVVVISDGIPTGKMETAEGGHFDPESNDFLRGLGVHVHSAWAGRDKLRDVAIARVLADDFAFVHTAVKIEVVVRASGVTARERTRPLTLMRDGKPVRTASAVIDPDSREAKVAFEFTPDAVGKYLYEVQTPVLPGEAITSNNSRAFVLRVIRDKIRVVQVAGRPSWDEKHLRALLKRDPNVDLVSFFILRTPTDLSRVPEDELSLIPFPTEELFAHELGGFDVLILQNFNYGPYGMGSYLQNIKDYVLGGGALVMLGGDVAFTSGGYAQTPIADVLPVELLGEELPQERLVSDEPFRMQLTADGERHPVTALKLDLAENRARWRGLPELFGVNLVAGPRPGATVLGVHPFLKARGGAPMPVLALGEFGKGRSLAFTTDTMWNWGFVAAGEGDDGRAYDKFWESAIRWLIRDPELRLLRVETDKAEYALGEIVRVDARLLGMDYRPARAQKVTLEVHQVGAAAGNAAPLVTRTADTDDEGEVHADVPAEIAGSYMVTARAKQGDKELLEEEVYLVRAEGRELEQPNARKDVLNALSAETGGIALGAVDSLPAELSFLPPRVVRIDSRTDVELWSLQAVFWLAIGALACEWILRRRRGYL
jgi:uncharacterized membrane protein